jgi:hypothetical protein
MYFEVIQTIAEVAGALIGFVGFVELACMLGLFVGLIVAITYFISLLTGHSAARDIDETT